MRHSIFHHAGKTHAVRSEAWPLLIKTVGYESIIFDCDGTLVESGDAHFRAFRSAVRAQGYEMERAWYDERTGFDRRSVLAAAAEAIDGPFDITLAVGESISAYLLNSSTVLPIAETVDLAKSVSPLYKLAVVTNSEKEIAEASLSAIGLQNHFNHIVTISSGLPPKPAPDLFIAAAELLNTSMATTLVLEDSKEGVRGAIRAGMDVLEVLPTP